MSVTVIASDVVATVCEDCGESVIEVVVSGVLVLAERAEVTPFYPCPSCEAVRARGDRPKDCPRCDNTRRVGTKLPAEAVALDERGHARLLRAAPSRVRLGYGVSRQPGDAIHARHQCVALARTG